MREERDEACGEEEGGVQAKQVCEVRAVCRKAREYEEVQRGGMCERAKEVRV